MPGRLYKNSRIVNINANIVIASVLATLLAIYPVYLTKMITHSKIAIVLLSFLIDAVIDLIIFTGLHIYVNKNGKEVKNKEIAKDVFKIQVQRGVLSILYFVIAVGLHYLLLVAGLRRVVAFIISYMVALIITRSVHTAYGVKTGLFKD